MIQYVLVFGITGAFFALLYEDAINDMGRNTLSQRERAELYKLQAAERVVLVGIMQERPLVFDLVNAGAPASIERLFVNGTEDPSFTVDGTGLRALVQNEISTVRSSLDGSEIAIVTQSGRIFRFG